MHSGLRGLGIDGGRCLLEDLKWSQVGRMPGQRLLLAAESCSVHSPHYDFDSCQTYSAW